MKARIISTTLAILAASSLSATAQDEGKRGGDRPQRKMPPEMLENFDTNKDGKLDEDERKAAGAARKKAMEKRRAAMIDLHDTDKDGKLSEDERKEARKAMEAKRKRILGDYDADQDGKLSPTERKAAIDAGEKIPAHPMKRRGGEGKGGPGARGPGKGKGGPDGKKGRGKGGPDGKKGPKGAAEAL